MHLYDIVLTTYGKVGHEYAFDRERAKPHKKKISEKTSGQQPKIEDS